MGSGNSQQPFLSSQKKRDFSINPALWRRKRTSFVQSLKSKGMLMKRKARCDRCMRPRNSIEKKVRILERMLPSCSDESMGVERLFRETADYIVALQLRVKLMQIMVEALSAGSDND